MSMLMSFELEVTSSLFGAERGFFSPQSSRASSVYSGRFFMWVELVIFLLTTGRASVMRVCDVLTTVFLLDDVAACHHQRKIFQKLKNQN